VLASRDSPRVNADFMVRARFDIDEAANHIETRGARQVALLACRTGDQALILLNRASRRIRCAGGIHLPSIEDVDSFSGCAEGPTHRSALTGNHVSQALGTGTGWWRRTARI